jgi:hypothetical protein
MGQSQRRDVLAYGSALGAISMSVPVYRAKPL